MSVSSGKRKTEDDLVDSVKKVKQSGNVETKDSNQNNMASTSLGDIQGDDSVCASRYKITLLQPLA